MCCLSYVLLCPLFVKFVKFLDSNDSVLVMFAHIQNAMFKKTQLLSTMQVGGRAVGGRHSGWWQSGGGSWPCRARPTPPASCAKSCPACNRTRSHGRSRRPTTSSAEKQSVWQVHTALCLLFGKWTAVEPHTAFELHLCFMQPSQHMKVPSILRNTYIRACL